MAAGASSAFDMGAVTKRALEGNNAVMQRQFQAWLEGNNAVMRQQLQPIHEKLLSC